MKATDAKPFVIHPWRNWGITFLAALLSVIVIPIDAWAVSGWVDGGTTLDYNLKNVGIKTSTLTTGIELDVAGDIAAQSGTALLPSLTFRLDTDTGLFSGGTNSNILGISTGGLERLRIDSTGKVGIGTTVPSYSLQIGLGGSQPSLGFGGGTNDWTSNAWKRTIHMGNNESIRFLGSTLPYYLIGAKNDQLYIGTASVDNNTGPTTYRMTITSAGNVGIGTVTPAYMLDVNGTARVAGNTTLGSLSSNTTTLNGNLGLAANSTTWASQFVNSNSGGYGVLIDAGTLGQQALRVRNYNGSSELFTVTGGGNVGVGTTLPNYKLDVTGQVRSSIGGFVFPDGTTQSTAVVPGTNYWTLSENNIYSNNSGNVGIGTTAPGRLLEVNGGSTLSAAILAKSTANAGSTVFESNSKNASGTVQNWQIGTNLALTSADFEIRDSTNAVSALTILKSTGNVGIGTTAPGSRLEVAGPIRMGSGGYIIGEPTYGIRLNNSADTLNLMVATEDGSKVYFPQGNLGIGTPSPVTKLELYGSNQLGMRFDTSGKSTIKLFNNMLGLGQTTALGIEFTPQGGFGNTLSSITGGWETSTSRGTLAFRTSSDGGSSIPERMVILGDGNVGIGKSNPTVALDVVGDVAVTGNIAAKYQDVAEWVPAATPISSGTVLVLDPEHFNLVEPSYQSYDTRVAGVVSNQPGILLGEAGENKVKVATTGRVKVKVDASKQPVQVGDLLVTSDQEGLAMRSEPLNLGGTMIHRPGTILGKALESLSDGQGEILVLLTLQ